MLQAPRLYVIERRIAARLTPTARVISGDGTVLWLGGCREEGAEAVYLA